VRGGGRRAWKWARAILRGGAALAIGATLMIGAPGCGIFGGKSAAKIGELTTTNAPSGEKKELVLRGGDDLNNCGEGPANVLGVRIYQLSGETAITSVPQAQLWENDEAELGKELLNKHEISLVPGSTEQVVLDLSLQARFVAVVGNFCQTEGECWRWVQPVDKIEGKTTLKFARTCVSSVR
jgi:type VI secretion system VasD/TssJ family lipoprotein